MGMGWPKGRVEEAGLCVGSITTVDSTTLKPKVNKAPNKAFERRNN
jgi:hypothetical protein